MSGYYPDGLDQASFNRYWDELLDDEPEDLEDDYWDSVNDCDGLPENPNADTLAYWQERSELFEKEGA